MRSACSPLLLCSLLSMPFHSGRTLMRQNVLSYVPYAADRLRFLRGNCEFYAFSIERQSKPKSSTAPRSAASSRMFSLSTVAVPAFRSTLTFMSPSAERAFSTRALQWPQLMPPILMIFVIYVNMTNVIKKQFILFLNQLFCLFNNTTSI